MISGSERTVGRSVISIGPLSRKGGYLRHQHLHTCRGGRLGAPFGAPGRRRRLRFLRGGDGLPGDGPAKGASPICRESTWLVSNTEKSSMLSKILEAKLQFGYREHISMGSNNPNRTRAGESLVLTAIFSPRSRCNTVTFGMFFCLIPRVRGANTSGPRRISSPKAEGSPKGGGRNWSWPGYNFPPMVGLGDEKASEPRLAPVTSAIVENSRNPKGSAFLLRSGRFRGCPPAPLEEEQGLWPPPASPPSKAGISKCSRPCGGATPW